MKRTLLLLACASVALFGCSNDNNTPAPANPSSGTMSAKIDGSAWSAALAVQATKTNGVFQVSGSDNSGKQMNVTIMNYNGPGTYALGGPATSGNGSNGRWTAGLSSDQTYNTMVGQGEGTCEITTESGGTVEGNFSFTAKNTDNAQVSVTEGTFKASL